MANAERGPDRGGSPQGRGHGTRRRVVLRDRQGRLLRRPERARARGRAPGAGLRPLALVRRQRSCAGSTPSPSSPSRRPTWRFADAGQVDVDPALAGVQIGTGVGGLTTMETQIGVLLDKGPRRVSPFLVPMMMANAGAATVSMRLGWRGPCETIATACASGTHSILAAHRLIASGRCDAVLAGGAEAAMTPVALAAFGNMTALSTSGQSRPFDVRRDGFVIAEGGAVLVLEELERAKARGAHIYAELLGGASTADAHHITAPAPGGVGAIGCMELALEDAGLTASDVAHVNAHGTSTPLNDLAEAEAIEKVFGRPGTARHLDQGRDRALARRGRSARGRRLRAVDRAAASSRRRSASSSRTRRSTSTSSGTSPASGNPDRSCRTASVSAGTTGASCSLPVPD